MAGVLLGKDSPLASGVQQGLMNDLVRQAQGDFIAGAADYTSTVLQSTGDAMTTARYVMMASGIGAPIGEPTAKVGNLMKTAGTAIEVGIDWVQGNQARAGYTITEHIHNHPYNSIISDSDKKFNSTLNANGYAKTYIYLNNSYRDPFYQQYDSRGPVIDLLSRSKTRKTLWYKD